MPINMQRTLILALFTTFAAAVYGKTAEAADSTRTLDEIVVTGSNSAVAARLMPYTVSVVTPAELSATGQPQLLAAISGQVPSLFVTQRGIFGFGVSNGGAGHIKMRGVGGDRASAVLMMLDGQPQFAGIYSHHVADFYDKDFAERVEVLRGPASVLYGSNAMAGTINVITKKVHADGIHASLTSQYGSYNTWLNTLTATARYGRFDMLVSGSYDRTDGNIDGMDFKQAGGYAKAGYAFGEHWRATADFALTSFHAHDPVWATLSNPDATDVYTQHVTRGEASMALSNTYGNTDGTARIYYSYGNHYIDDPRHFHSLDDRFGVMLYQNIKPWQGAAATVGFDFNTYTGKIPMSGGTAHTPGAMGTISRKSVTEYSPYLTYSQTLIDERIVLNGGVRMANSDKFGTRWVPQGGFVLRLPAQIDMKASAAMGYRNPSFRELYLYRMANANLEPERMWNYEVSFSRNFGHLLSAQVTAYYAKGDNLIQVVDNHNENTGRFINRGIEASLSSRPLSNLSLQATYSYLHSSLDNLTGAPRHQYYIGADWQVHRLVRLSADVKGVAHLFVHSSIAPQSYALLNLKAEYAVWRHLTLFTRLENITDARYTINRGYPMPGFTAMGGFRLSI